MSRFGFTNENIYGQKKRSLFILNEINHHGKNRAPLKILDFGCGTGEMITFPIAEKGYTITGMDLDQKSIQRANKINPFANASFICKNILNYSTESRFDVIICSEVLEHLENPEIILLALTKLLNSDGIMIVTIPNGIGPFEFEQFLLKCLLTVFPSLKDTKKKMMLKEIEKRGIMMTENLDSEHIQFFTLKKFQKLIGSCNLIIEKSEKSCFIAGPFSNQIIKHFPVIIDINVNKITRFIPFRLCSGWYFIARKK